MPFAPRLRYKVGVMGYWSYEPNGNDSTQDALGAVHDAADTLVRTVYELRSSARRKNAKARTERARSALLHHLTPFDRAGVVVDLLERGFFLPFTAVDQAASDLMATGRDKNWLASYRDPAEVRRALREVAASLHRLLRGEEARFARVSHRLARAGRRRSRAAPERFVIPPRGWQCRTEAQRARTRRRDRSARRQWRRQVAAARHRKSSRRQHAAAA